MFLDNESTLFYFIHKFWSIITGKFRMGYF